MFFDDGLAELLNVAVQKFPNIFVTTHELGIFTSQPPQRIFLDGFT